MWKVIAIIFFASASFASGERPSWIDGDWKGDYPEEKYLVSVGSGPNRNAAIQDAKKSLAELFRAKVSSETRSESASELKESTDASQSGSAAQKLQSGVTISTAVELRGLQVAKHWVDAEKKEHFALAVIDRLKLKSSYSMELLKKKRDVQAAHEAFRAGPSVGKGQKLLALIEKFEALSEEASVVGAGMPVTEALQGAEVDSIREKIDELKDKNIVAFQFQGLENHQDFSEELSSCLSDRGVSIQNSGEPAQFKVTCKFSEKQKHIKVQDWVKYDYSAALSVQKDKGRIDRKRFQMESSGRDREQAFEGAVKKLSQQVCDWVVDSVSK